MRLIENLELEHCHWKFTENGILYFLTSPKKRDDEQKFYVLKSIDVSSVEKYKIFGSGNLIKDNEVNIHFVLNKVETNEFYIISAEALNVVMCPLLPQ